MKDQSFSIGGTEAFKGAAQDQVVSIVFPGKSIETLDLSLLDRSVNIAVNQTISRVSPEYCFVLNPAMIAKIFYYFDLRAETNLVIGQACSDLLETNPPHDHRQGFSSYDKLKSLKSVSVWPPDDEKFSNDEENTVVGVLDFACWLDPYRIDLYGLDLCSHGSTTHAFNGYNEPGNGMMVSKKGWASEKWIRTKKTVEEFAKESRWPYEINNKSQISTLECFLKEV